LTRGRSPIHSTSAATINGHAPPIEPTTRSAALSAVRSLLDETAFAFENRDAVARAAVLFEHSARGFSDYLVAARHAQLGCNFTATFDSRMRKLPGVRVICAGLSSNRQAAGSGERERPRWTGRRRRPRH